MIVRDLAISQSQVGIGSQGHTLLERVSGADAPTLTQALAKHATGSSTKPLSQTNQAPAPASNANIPMDGIEKQETPEELERRMRGLMNQSTVVLFMKGSPDAPRCGFSRKISALLKNNDIQFTHFDILLDENVRQGRSTFASICSSTEPSFSRRTQEIERLAHVPPAYRKGRTSRRLGYCPGND